VSSVEPSQQFDELMTRHHVQVVHSHCSGKGMETLLAQYARNNKCKQSAINRKNNHNKYPGIACLSISRHTYSIFTSEANN
jgi:hypothetical protein